jgi:hypothetical protein
VNNAIHELSAERNHKCYSQVRIALIKKAALDNHVSISPPGRRGKTNGSERIVHAQDQGSSTSAGSRLVQQEIARSSGIRQPTVHRYLERAEAAGLSWPLPEDCDDHRCRN